jgi:hypothetical protein
VDPGTALAFASLILAVAAAPFLIRGRTKDTTIRTLTEAYDAEVRLRETKEEELRGAQTRADREHEMRQQVERKLSASMAQYEELRKYAAPDVLHAVSLEIRALRTAAEGGFTANGELLLKSVEVLAGLETSVAMLAEALRANGGPQ